MAARAIILNVTCYYYWSDVNKPPIWILKLNFEIVIWIR